MLSFLRSDQVDLRAGRSQRAIWLTLLFYTKKKQFSHISKVEPNASSVRQSVFANFFPHNITFILKSPSIHNR